MLIERDNVIYYDGGEDDRSFSRFPFLFLYIDIRLPVFAVDTCIRFVFSRIIHLFAVPLSS